MQCPPGWRPFIDGRPHKLKFNPRDASRVGRAFPMGGVSESGDWILSLEWDMLSQRQLNGKPHPTISPRNGTHFPKESQRETTSHNQLPKWDTLSR